MSNSIGDLSISEIKSILIDNDFKYIDIESEDINEYLTLGQIVNKVSQPIGIKEIFEIVSMTGTIKYIDKKEYPNNPEFCVFSIITDEDDDNEEKIKVFYKKSFLDEIEKIINSHELFLEYMKKINNEQLRALLGNENKVSISIDTTGLNSLKNKIISISMMEFNNKGESVRDLFFYINNDWNEYDIDLYTKKSKYGKRLSAYDYLNLDLPNMVGINKNVFTDSITVLRAIYKITKGKSIIVENKGTVDFIDNFFKSKGIEEDYLLSKIINCIIEPSRIAKKQKGKYIKKIIDLKNEYGIYFDKNGSNNFYAYGRSLDIKKIAIQMINHEKNKNI